MKGGEGVKTFVAFFIIACISYIVSFPLQY